MKKYREWVYKISFFICCQVGAMFGAIFSGDMLKIWEEGTEFNISVEEVR